MVKLSKHGWPALRRDSEPLELSVTIRTPSVAKTLRIFFAALVAAKWLGCRAWRGGHRLAP